MLGFTNKKIYIVLLLALVAPLVIYFIQSFFGTTEFKTAYEKYNDVLTRAKLTLDTSELYEVATGNALEKSLTSVGALKESPPKVLTSVEVSITPFGFSILEYDEGRRVLIEARIKTRGFELDPRTGKRKYYGNGKWFTEQVELIREDNSWKVRTTEVIDWEQW